MVEDRITDGTRIGQLLASELTGLERDALADVSVVDADPDADPSPDGTVAYGVAHAGERVADVVLFPDRVVIEPREKRLAFGLGEGTDGGAVETVERGGGAAVAVTSGAAVKRAVDLLARCL